MYELDQSTFLDVRTLHHKLVHLFFFFLCSSDTVKQELTAYKSVLTEHDVEVITHQEEENKHTDMYQGFSLPQTTSP